jgi:hypothetical protein
VTHDRKAALPAIPEGTQTPELCAPKLTDKWESGDEGAHVSDVYAANLDGP